MDTLNSNKLGGPNMPQPTPLKEDLDKPIPFDVGGPGKANVSHAPLNLGAGPAAPAAKIGIPKPVAKTTAAKIVSTDRITGVRSFFTKLHPGALQFLDEQISNWLKENPGIVIKRTNITTGEIQAKKTEPNLIITVWY